MISISNPHGLMSNSISYSTISRIAGAAQHNAVLAKAGLEVVDHSRDMSLCERLYDYLLCAGVKTEYMDYLYELSRHRVHDGLYQKYRERSGPDDTNRLRSTYHIKMEECEYHMARLMSGGSLKYGSDTVEGELQLDEYLVFRSKPGCTPAGIPVGLPSSGPTLKEILISSVPSFAEIGHVRIRHLKTIQQNGQVVFKGQSYNVRFTKDDEPVVLLSEQVQNSGLLQRRLKNLWMIKIEMQRLAYWRNRPLDIPDCELSNNLMKPQHTDTDKEACLAAVTQWRMFAELAQKKMVEIVVQLQARLNNEKCDIELALRNLERRALPTSADAEEFQRLKEKIKSFKKEPSEVIRAIQDVRLSLCFLIGHLSDRECLEQMEVCKLRLLNFVNQMGLIFSSGVGEKERKYFQQFCMGQREFIDGLSDQYGGMHSFSSLAKQQPWSYAGIYPTVFREQRDQVLNMINDPTSTVEQAKALGERLQAEREALIVLKTRQIEHGLKLDAILAIPVPGSEDLLFRKGYLSSECDICIDALVQMRGELLNPGKDFTAAQLDDLGREQDRLLQPVIKGKHIDFDKCVSDNFPYRRVPILSALPAITGLRSKL